MTTTHRSTEPIDEQAARWTARLDGGAMSQADRLALHAWLDEDPAHRTAFEHYQLICDDTAESLPVLAKLSPVARPDPAPRRRVPRWVPVALGLAACAAIAALWVVPYFRDTQMVATVAAQRSTLTLPDGSQTDLNAQTKLYIDFRHDRRFVRLEKGEAYFAVAKDAAHPFSVETPAGTVRVTGTHFNVRLAADGRPEVTLLDGSIAFQNAAAQVMLVPCEQINADGELRHLSAEELDQVTAWREGRIVLNGLSLGEAAARFAAFHGKTITVAPELAAVQMGGSYSLDDLQGFFEGLSSEPLRLRVVQRDTDNFAIIRR
jgi:transmembrane sensor